MNSADTIPATRRSFAWDEWLAKARSAPTRAATTSKQVVGAAEVVVSAPSAITSTSTPAKTIIL